MDLRSSLYSIWLWIVLVLVLPLALIAAGGVVVAAIDREALVFDGQQFAWLGAVVPVTGALWLWGVYGKRRSLRRFASNRMAGLLVERLSSTRQAVRAAMTVLAALLIVAGIIGPRWGMYLEKQRVRGVDVVVALDVSRSMLAEDVAPNRLERTKQLIRQQLVERDAFKQANRLGLVAFAGSASLRLPLTTDHLAFKNRLESLTVGSVPRGGTAIGEAIHKCIELFERSPEEATRLILLFTDGEDHEGDPIAAAQTAWQEHRIQVFTVGVGDPTRTVGAQVPVVEGGARKPLLHDGQIVFSKLDVAGLTRIADAADGRFVPLQGLPDLVTAIANMRKIELTTEERIRHRPRYQWFVAAALLLLMLEPFVNESIATREVTIRRLWQTEASA